MKLVSKIISCYNQVQYLPDILQSVLDQSYTNWECIIVNDGSPDATEEVAQRWCEKDSRRRLHFVFGLRQFVRKNKIIQESLFF